MALRTWETEDSLTNYPPILIIDDDKWMQKIVSHYISSWGFEAISASDAIDGIALAINYPPSLIFIDLIMPEINGILLLKMLKKIEITSNIPIAIISGNFNRDVVSEALRNGAAAVVGKPFSEKVLLDKVQDCFGHSILYKIKKSRFQISDMPITKL
ncbi:MAG: two-component system, chemotaxis family, chemotaxis protein CheY [Bacteroidota bacterium]|nr:two-component system, chemotaxis family, chemotaxis protein CheY [Bacteroidota bacterium]